jgi:hypothetical protein
MDRLLVKTIRWVGSMILLSVPSQGRPHARVAVLNWQVLLRILMIRLRPYYLLTGWQPTPWDRRRSGLPLILDYRCHLRLQRPMLRSLMIQVS